MSDGLTICDWFEFYSRETWRKLCFSRMTNLKISETTITQNLIFDFWTLAATHNYPLDLYEARNEKANGNDLEILIETSNGYLLFPCQAKIVQKGDKYTSITHKNNNNFQIDLLIDYAKLHGGIPIYLFYNYCCQPLVIQRIEKSKGVPIQNLGLTIANAKAIKNFYFAPSKKKNWTIPNFESLHLNLAFPLHYLVCNLNTNRIMLYLEDLGFQSNRFYSRDQILGHPFWKDLAPEPRIGYITSPGEQPIIGTSRQLNSFSPKFRLVIHRYLRERTIRRHYR